MKIQRLPLGKLQTNCYLLFKENRVLIIDPADDAVFISDIILREKAKPTAILLTHGHFDHLLAAGELQKNFDIPAFCHKNDEFLVKRAKETAEYFLNHPLTIIPAKYSFFQDKLKIDGFYFKTIHTPGHTPGGCCFYFEKEDLLFSGDTLFKSGIGRYDFSYSDKNLLKKSLQKLNLLPEDTTVYPGHGEKTSIRDEFPYVFDSFFKD